MLDVFRRRYGPLPGWAWGLIIAGLAYLYLRYNQQRNAMAAAQASSQGMTASSSNLGTVPVSNLTTAAQPMPIQLGDTFVSNPVNLSTNTTTNVPITNVPPPATVIQPGNPPPPPPPPTPAAPPSQPGYGLVNTVQGLMVWLGVNQANSPVFNVGGGAPVYWGNAQNLAVGGQYEKPGMDIYTPVGYAQQVSAQATPLSQPYVGG